MATGDNVIIQCQAEITAINTPTAVQNASNQDAGYGITAGAVDIYVTNNGNWTAQYTVWVQPGAASRANKQILRGSCPPLESVKVSRASIPLGANDAISAQASVASVSGSVTVQVLGDGESV